MSRPPRHGDWILNPLSFGSNGVDNHDWKLILRIGSTAFAKKLRQAREAAPGMNGFIEFIGFVESIRLISRLIWFLWFIWFVWRHYSLREWKKDCVWNLALRTGSAAFAKKLRQAREAAPGIPL